MKRLLILSVIVACVAANVGCESSSTSQSSSDDLRPDEAAAGTDVVDDDREDAAASTEPESPNKEEASDDPKSIRSPEQLAAALKEKNPQFSGQVQMQPISPELFAVAIQDGNLRDISPLARQRIGALDLSKCDITDLSPLEGLPIVQLYLEENERLSDISALRGMPLQELYLSNTRVENIGPLRGAPLTKFNAVGTRIKDLSPLESCPIEMLWLTDCPVKDISPLKKVPLVSLTLENTEVDDISPLAGHPVIQRLHIGRAEVTDLTPVGQMKLTRLIFTPSKIKKGIDVVRNSPTLQELGTNFDNRMPPSIFWSMYDEGKLE